MMNPIEAASVCIIGLAALIGTMFVLPRQKPEPPPTQAESTQEALKRCEQHPERMCVVRVEPEPVKTDVQRVDEVAKDVGEIKNKQQSLIELVKQVTAEEKRK